MPFAPDCSQITAAVIMLRFNGFTSLAYCGDVIYVDVKFCCHRFLGWNSLREITISLILNFTANPLACRPQLLISNTILSQNAKSIVENSIRNRQIPQNQTRRFCWTICVESEIYNPGRRFHFLSEYKLPVIGIECDDDPILYICEYEYHLIFDRR